MHMNAKHSVNGKGSAKKKEKAVYAFFFGFLVCFLLYTHFRH